jgi:signal transduction histidine kinase
MDQVRQADRLVTVGKLASGVAHELGTPLNVVWARAKMVSSLGTATGSVDTANNGRIIAEQCENMTKIIRQLLDFARPRSPRKARVDLCQLVQHVLTLLSPMAQKKKVSFVTPVETTTALTAEIDANQIQQVLLNLVMNGIQAMGAGGALTVQVERRRASPPQPRDGAPEEYVALSVEDQGTGIPEEVRRHLFEPFFTTKGVGEGTGLGLSVSRGIVEEHRGWIEVQTEPEKGSRFTVFLPER